MHKGCVSALLFTRAPSHEMHPSAARDVDRPQFLEESVVAPEPPGGEAVHNGVHEGEDAVGVEVASGKNFKKDDI